MPHADRPGPRRSAFHSQGRSRAVTEDKDVTTEPSKPLSDREIQYKIKNFYDSGRPLSLRYRDQEYLREYLSAEDFDKTIPAKERIRAFGI